MKELKITEKTKEALFNRVRVKFEISQGSESVPSRLQVRELLSLKLKKNKEIISIRKITSDFGTSNIKGEAIVYDSKESLAKIEPKYTSKRLKVKAKEAKKKEEKVAEPEKTIEEKKESSNEPKEEKVPESEVKKE